MSDTQVWKIKHNGDHNTTHGLMVVCVDDFLILSALGEMRSELINKMRSTWDMCDEMILKEGQGLKLSGA